MVDFRIVVQVDTSKAAKGVKEIDTSLNKVEKSANRVNDTLKKAFTVAGIGLLVREFIQLSDVYTNVTNRLKLITKGTQQLESAQKALFAISKETRVSFEATGELYNRLGLAVRDLGVGQAELGSIVKSVNQAVVLSGASAQEAHAGMIQFSQGLASGALRGDELRSVLEQLPTIADIIAKELKVTRGELRDLGKDGKLTTAVILSGFKNAREELENNFAKTVPTIGQAFAVFKTNVIELIASFNDATGTVTALSRGIVGLGNNLETLVKIFQAAAITTALYFTAIKVDALTSFISKLVASSAAARVEAVAVQQAALANKAAAAASYEAATADAAATAAAITRTRTEIAKAKAVSLGFGSSRADVAQTNLVNLLDKQGKQTKIVATTQKQLAATTNAVSAANVTASKTTGAFGASLAKALPLLRSLGPALAVGTIVAFSDKISIASDRLATLEDVGNATVDNMISSWRILGKEIDDGLTEALTAAEQELGVFGSVMAATFGDANVSVEGFIRLLAKNADTIIGIMFVIPKTIEGIFKGLPAALADIFIRAFNGVKDVVQEAINFIIRGINTLRRQAGLEELLEIDFPDIENKYREGTKNLAQIVKDSFGEISGFSPVEDVLDEILTKAEREARGRRLEDLFPQETGAGVGRTTPPRTPGADQKDKFPEFIEGLKEEITLLQLGNREREVAEALMKAQAAAGGTLTEAQTNLTKAAVEEIQTLKDRSALQEFEQSLKNEIELLKTSSDELEAKTAKMQLADQITRNLTAGEEQYVDALIKEKQALEATTAIEGTLQNLQRENELLQANIEGRKNRADILRLEDEINRSLTPGEEERVATAIKENERLQAKASFLEGLKSPAREAARNVDFLNEALADGQISLSMYFMEMEKLNQVNLSFGQSLSREIDTMNDSLKTSAEIMGDVITAAADVASQAIVNFATTGEFEIQKLLQSFFAMILKITTQQLITSAITGIAGAFGGGGGFTNLGANANGGSYQIGGSGGTDSQFVTMLATPGERVDVLTPGQQNNQTTSSATPQNITIVNVTDPNEAITAMNTSEGQRVILNTIERNPNTVRKLTRQV